MKTYKVTFADGNSFVTGFNGDIQTAREYYIGNAFNFGDTEEHPKDLMIAAISVEEVVS